MKKVYIYYPSKITGGAEFLLKTVADILKGSIDVCVVDIEGGWLSSNIEGVQKIIIQEGRKIFLDKNSVLITTANLLRNLDFYFSGEFKVIGWIVQVNNLIPIFPKFGAMQFKRIFKYIFKETLLKSEYKKINNLASYLESNDSLFTMDDACNFVFYKYFGWKVSNYFPVVIPDWKIISPNDFKKTKCTSTRCVWLGRLDDLFKNPILHHVLLDLDRLSKQNGVDIVFDIIGNGPGLAKAQKVARQTDKIKINFLGEMRGHQLIDKLSSYDMGFAMGTSALEISACGVPVVLLDASYAKVPEAYKYQWLYESKGYCIGRSIDAALDKTLGNKKNIKEIFDEFLSDGDSIRNSCYEHVKNYHSVKILEDKLFLALENATSNFKDMVDLGLLNKPYWYFIKRLLK